MTRPARTILGRMFLVLLLPLLQACVAPTDGSLSRTASEPPVDQGDQAIQAPGSADAPRLPANPVEPVPVSGLTFDAVEGDAESASPLSYGQNPAIDALAPPEGSAAYRGWSALVAAGDNEADGGGLTLAFDNARQDVAASFLRWGVAARHMRQMSDMPDQFPGERLKKASVRRFQEDLALLKMGTGEGCLFYLTSHGTREGILMGETILSPQTFWQAVSLLCGRQPVIAVISACFSGVFIKPEFRQPNRYILTAAREDRNSFGCGVDNVYPYFDTCFLQTARTVTDWVALGEGVQACVAAREARENISRPSEPQLHIGNEIRPDLRALPVGDTVLRQASDQDIRPLPEQ